MSKKKKLNIRQNLQQIIEYGLWPPNLQIPDDTLLERIEKLNKEIRDRRLQIHLPEKGKKAILNKLRDQYNLKSSQTRKERKEKAQLDKAKKQQNWDKKRKSNFTFLGKGVSNWLNYTKEDKKLLKKFKLPSIKNAKSLANLLETDIPTLKWLSFHNKTTKSGHYIHFSILKKNGSKRSISKPKHRLSVIQQKLKTEILDLIEWQDDIHGFIGGRSNFTNAKIHENSRIFVNADIRDFFPSTRFGAVRSGFSGLGYSGEISTVLALLTTTPVAKEIKIRDELWVVNTDWRCLPQGASTSPLVSNLAFLKVDEQFRKRAKQLNFLYTRYADDLTFSSWTKTVSLKPLIYMIHKTLSVFNYEVNPRKFRILGRNDRQEVTGLTLNEGIPLIPRTWRRNVRVGVHQFQFMEGEEKNEVRLSLSGSLSYMKLTHRLQASSLVKKLK